MAATGQEKIRTPHLDALARQGLIFEQHIAQSGWTIPALSSLLTGRWPMAVMAHPQQLTWVPQDARTLLLPVTREDVLGAVAVVHVEIDDGDALGGAAGDGVVRGDRDVVEQAESHRGRLLGVVAGWANRAERVARPAGRDLVDGEAGRAAAAQRGVHGAR